MKNGMWYNEAPMKFETFVVQLSANEQRLVVQLSPCEKLLVVQLSPHEICNVCGTTEPP